MKILELHNHNIENNLNDFLPQDSVIILNNHYRKKHFESFNVFSIYEFCEFILRKSPLLFYPQTLSDSAGIFIIDSLIKNIFKKNTALFNLTKSNAFSKELYALFGRFLDSELSADTLLNLLSSSDISSEDSQRFELIVETYDKYLTLIKELDYIDRRDLCRYTRSVLEQFPLYLKKVKKDFSNIIIDRLEKHTQTESFLFLSIGSKIHQLEITSAANNPLAASILKKYLPEKSITFNNKISQSRLIEFNDLSDEAIFIAKEIIKKVKSEKLKYEDFTIVLNNSTALSAFDKVFREANIPTNITKVDKDYQNFLIKLSQYLNICSGLKETKREFLLKADYERIFDEINLNFENIISETLENQFIKDRFLAIQQNTKELSLIKCVENNLNILNINESKKIQCEFKKIETLIDLFNEGKITNLIAYVAEFYSNKSTEFQQSLAALIKKINTLEKLTYKIKNSKLQANVILDIINSKMPKYNLDTNGINIVNFKNLKTITSKEIYIPDLTEKSTPDKNNSTQFLAENSSNKITSAIKTIAKDFKNIILDNNDLLKESAQNIVAAIVSAENQITLTTHKYEDKKQIASSIFFQYLKTEFPQFIIQPEFEESNTFEYEQTSLNFSPLQDKIVISDENIIKLNPSAISSFQSCPRKFYFKHLLGLKDTGSFAANYGTIVHAIMENFNSKYLASYSKETMTKLTESLFNAATNPENALSAGFSKSVIERIEATDFLSLKDMKTQFDSAIDELERHGFFEQIPDEIINEKSFNFSIPELPNVLFDGRIDAIYRFGEKYIVVDFKTGKTKPELNYLISDNGVTFKTKTGKLTNEETKQNEYEYQIPIYYLACQNAPELAELKNKITSLGLLYIRPKNKDGGFKKDFAESFVLDEYLPKIINNLNNTIIAKIRNKEYYPTNSNEIICQNCSFKYLCDTIENQEGEND